MDASTLGKIDIQGRDAATLLDWVYTNAWDKLGVGRCRYGLMLDENGMVMDDGVTTRLADDHFLMTTTTGGARARDGVARALAADRMAAPRGLPHVGDRPLGDRERGRAAQPRRRAAPCARASTSRRRRFRSWPAARERPPACRRA